MRYIDADQMLEVFKELHGRENDLLNCYNAVWIESFIEDYPTADVQKVRHGTWDDCLSVPGWYRCSSCYAARDRAFEYCPHCGAKMDGAT